MANMQLATGQPDARIVRSFQGPLPAQHRTPRLARLPTELRWQIYECLATVANGELEYIRDHCKCGYDFTRCDEGEPKTWQDADCDCIGVPEAWLDSAFPETTALQQDGLTLTNLFMAFPELDPDMKLLDILCFRWGTYMARPVVDHLHNTLRLLRTAQCQDIISEIAMDLGHLEANSIRGLLNFLRVIGYCGLIFRYALRIRGLLCTIGVRQIQNSMQSFEGTLKEPVTFSRPMVAG